MAHGKTDTELIQTTRNTARFFTENRHVAWMLLVATLGWGVFSFVQMPKRKDPLIIVRRAVAICPWPGAGAEKIEQLVTRKLEERIAQNPRVERIESTSRGSVALIYFSLDERVADTGKEFDDIRLKLDSIRDLPGGAGPIELLKDFGDTAALMLTVASPKASQGDIVAQARAVQRAIVDARRNVLAAPGRSRITAVIGAPRSADLRVLTPRVQQFVRYAEEKNVARDPHPISGAGFIGVDFETASDGPAITTFVETYVRERLHTSEIHPDVWPLAIVRDPAETLERMSAVAGDKYSYRELDDFTDLIGRTLQSVPLVSKVTRSGVLEERIYLEYSQERLASYGLEPKHLVDVLAARNITVAGGMLEIENKNLIISPSGDFKSEKDLGNVLVGASPSGTPLYLRDAADTVRDYESPPRYLNFSTRRGPDAKWIRTRAITLAVQMRAGEQIGAFGDAIDVTLASLQSRLPADLVMARTSDQPLQVRENTELFMRSLLEAVALVVLITFIGFREWRSAALMAAAIPITLAMTVGIMQIVGLDIQQVSIGALIIALGLLIDDPVVAGDAIKRELAAGHTPIIASWLGPTKLAKAILYATITNIVAYLPLLLVGGESGRFIYSVPVVLTASLVASRIVSMTFIPLLAYYVLRPARKPEPSLAERRTRGFSGFYYRLGSVALERRWSVTLASVLALAICGFLVRNIPTEFFPKDYSYLFFADLWLPEDAPLSATNESARRAEQVIRQTADKYAGETGDSARPVLRSVTTFVGGGGPRFWFSVAPELRQLNYAQLIIQVEDKLDTSPMVVRLQQALSAEVPGARIDVRRLETTKPIGVPVAVRISGEDIPTLRALAEQVKNVFLSNPQTDRVRDDWGADSFVVNLHVDPDRANLAGISNLDVAASSAVGTYGYQVTSLREGHKQIPVMVRLRMEDRAQLSDIENMYVYSLENSRRVPLRQVSSIEQTMQIEKIRRRNQFRTITVGCFPVPGVLPSQVMAAARPAITDLTRSLPPGYRLEVGGEEEEQNRSFKELGVVMAVSVVCIFLALVIQFNDVFKPLIVFAAIPFGMVGALVALRIMNVPFGFTAFMGLASLVGVIVSHVIVLFDFVEEMHERGEPLREALLDAGIVRLRPVFITVGATILALVPLAQHGGPLWEGLCYAQIGGLVVANYVTKVLVPALYAIFVLDLKIVKWDTKTPRPVSAPIGMSVSRPSEI